MLPDSYKNGFRDNYIPKSKWEYKLDIADAHNRIQENSADEEKRQGHFKSEGIFRTRPVLYLHEIACGLFKEIKNKNITSDSIQTEDKKKLAQIKEKLVKVQKLANKQVDLDKKDKYIPVKNFFSALRNFFTVGKFESSAILAKKLSEGLLKKLEEGKEGEKEVAGEQLKAEPKESAIPDPIQIEVPKKEIEEAVDQNLVEVPQEEIKKTDVGNLEEEVTEEALIKRSPEQKKEVRGEEDVPKPFDPAKTTEAENLAKITELQNKAEEKINKLEQVLSQEVEDEEETIEDEKPKYEIVIDKKQPVQKKDSENFDVEVQTLFNFLIQSKEQVKIEKTEQGKKKPPLYIINLDGPRKGKLDLSEVFQLPKKILNALEKVNLKDKVVNALSKPTVKLGQTLEYEIKDSSVTYTQKVKKEGKYVNVKTGQGVERELIFSKKVKAVQGPLDLWIKGIKFYNFGNEITLIVDRPVLLRMLPSTATIEKSEILDYFTKIDWSPENLEGSK